MGFQDSHPTYLISPQDAGLREFHMIDRLNMSTGAPGSSRDAAPSIGLTGV